MPLSICLPAHTNKVVGGVLSSQLHTVLTCARVYGTSERAIVLNEPFKEIFEAVVEAATK